MYEALLKATPEYQKVAASFGSAGPAALFGLPPAGRALLYAALQKDLGRVLCIVTPGEAEATHFADDLKALGLTAAVCLFTTFHSRNSANNGNAQELFRLFGTADAGIEHVCQNDIGDCDKDTGEERDGNIQRALGAAGGFGGLIVINQNFS